MKVSTILCPPSPSRKLTTRGSGTVKDRAACEDEYAEELEESEDDVEDPTDRANIMGEVDLLAVHTDSKMLPRAIDFALKTAMRRSELASLRWANVQMRTRAARLPKTKTVQHAMSRCRPEHLTSFVACDRTCWTRRGCFR